MAPCTSGVQLGWKTVPPELEREQELDVLFARAFEEEPTPVSDVSLKEVECAINKSVGSPYALSVVIGLFEPQVVRIKIQIFTKESSFETDLFVLVTKAPALTYSAGINARGRVVLKFAWTPLNVRLQNASSLELCYRFVRMRVETGSEETLCETPESCFEVTFGGDDEGPALFKFILFVERKAGDGEYGFCETEEPFTTSVLFYRNPPRPKLIHGDSTVLRFQWEHADLETIEDMERSVKLPLEIVLDYLETNHERLKLNEDVHAAELFETSCNHIVLKSLEDAIEFRDLLPGSRLLLRTRWRVAEMPEEQELGHSAVGVYSTAAVRPGAPELLDADHKMYEGSIRRNLYLYLHLQWCSSSSGGAPIRFFEVQRMDKCKNGHRWTPVYSGDSTECVLSAICPRNRSVDLGYFFRIRTVTVAGSSDWTTKQLHIRSQTLRFVQKKSRPKNRPRKKKSPRQREERLRRSYTGYLANRTDKPGRIPSAKKPEGKVLARALTKSGWMTHSYKDMLTASIDGFRELPATSASQATIKRPALNGRSVPVVPPPNPPEKKGSSSKVSPRQRFNMYSSRSQSRKSVNVAKKLKEDGIAWTFERKSPQVSIPEEDNSFLRARELYVCNLHSCVFTQTTMAPRSVEPVENNPPKAQMSIAEVETALTKLQHHVRRRLEERRERNAAAVRVQTIVRGKLSRSHYRLQLATRKIQHRVCAKRIQSVYRTHRAFVQRQQRERNIQSSICVQAQWRGHYLRKARRKMEVERLQVDLRATSIQETFEQIQSKDTARTIQQDKAHMPQLTAESAAKIQSIYRGVRTRVSMKARKESVLKIQKTVRGLKVRRQVEHHKALTLIRAAVRMQKVYRAHKTLQEYARRKRIETNGIVHINILGAGHGGCNGLYEMVSTCIDRAPSSP